MSLVIYAKDKARLSTFYAQTLGIPLMESAESHDVLRGAGIELIVHAIPAPYAADITITVNDGTGSASRTFLLDVQSKPTAPANLRVVQATP